MEFLSLNPLVVTPFVSDDVAVNLAGVHAGWKAVKAFCDPIFDEMHGRIEWFVDEFIPAEDPDVIVTRSHNHIEQAGESWGKKHIAYTGRYVQVFRFAKLKVRSLEEYHDTAFLNSKYGA